MSNSLTVVAQTLIDGCSTTESDPLLAQAQSTSKVLFSKSVHNNFREWVQSYFQEVQMREEIPRDDFILFLRVREIFFKSESIIKSRRKMSFTPKTSIGTLLSANYLITPKR